MAVIGSDSIIDGHSADGVSRRYVLKEYSFNVSPCQKSSNVKYFEPVELKSIVYCQNRSEIDHDTY